MTLDEMFQKEGIIHIKFVSEIMNTKCNLKE